MRFPVPAFVLLFLLLVATANADDGGWWIGVSCDGSANNPVKGAFSACKSSNCAGGSFSGSGECQRVSNLTKLSFLASADGTLRSSARYAMQTGDIFVGESFLTTEEKPLFAVRAHCPVASHSLNWLFVQWDSNERPMDDTYLLGDATYSAAAGIKILHQYDVDGGTYFAGTVPMPGSCTNGVYPVNDPKNVDLDGNVYFAASGHGVFRSTAGHATFFFPQQAHSTAFVASRTTSGIAFDSRLATNTSPVQVVIDADGDQYTVTPYTNVDTGSVVGAAWTDVIAITGVNVPQPGMLMGTVSRNGGTARKLACIVTSHFDHTIICSGQSPADPAYPYTVSFVVEGSCPPQFLRVPYNADVGTTTDFCAAKFEMKIVGDDNGDQPYNPTFLAQARDTGTPWVNISRPQAIAECQALSGELITNAQWQTLARNIEDAYDNGGYVNWSTHEQDNSSGESALNQGHADATPNNTLAAAADNSPCAGTGQTSCNVFGHADFSQKRTHQLSTGEILWDLSGNATEWVSDDNLSVQGADDYLNTRPWLAGGQAKWGPRGSYHAAGTDPKLSSPFGGIGFGYLNYAVGAILRGGNWYEGDYAGVFYTWLNGGTGGNNEIGFRCVFNAL